MKRSTNLVIISGPSGSGKDSVIDGLAKKGLPIERVITTETRKMRKGESQGKPYYFKSKSEFEKLIKAKKLAEWANVYGDLRGVTFDELDRVKSLKNKIGIWNIDWHGVIRAKELYPDVLAILISTPSINELVSRVKKRGKDSEQTIQKRISFSKEWMKHKNIYDYEVWNLDGKLNQTVDQVIKILKKEGFRIGDFWA